MSRNMRLTPHVAHQILEALRDGKDVSEVCAAVDISRATFYRWLKDGKRDIKPYDQFYTAVCTATAVGDKKRHADLIASLNLSSVA